MTGAFPEADSRLAHVKGVVLCTGSAGPLHALRFGAHTLAERAAALLANIVHDVVWVGAASPGDGSGRAAAARPVSETSTTGVSGDLASLAALLDALEAVPRSTALVVSADRPLLSPDLLIGLAGRPDAPAVVPRDASGAHLLCARYDAAVVVPELRRCLAAGDPGAFFETTPVQWLEGAALAALDPDGTKLRRVESAAELDRIADADSRRTGGAWPGHPGLGWPAEAGQADSSPSE